jgi:O-antigen/teichoic acid export membrane protein
VTTAATAWHREDRRLLMFVRNISSRYLIIVISAGVSLLLVPFNLQYLGTAAYGLWMLTASITTYFSVLELGYGSATVKYVAEYRARGDSRALNEIASTTFFLFSALGLACYGLAIGIAMAMPGLFELEAGQARTGQIILLIIAVNVALHFVFAVFGGVVNGFERNYRNAVPAIVSSLVAAGANVAVLLLGYGLVELVAVTTAIRIAPYWWYRRNAYLAFPELRISPACVRRDRLRELTGFSAYLAIIDWSARLTYTSALVIVGALLSTTAVAIYSIGAKLTDAMVHVTSQLHTLLFPVMVNKTVQGTTDDQRRLLVRAARFQLAVAIALAGTTAAVADVLIPAWVERGAPVDGLAQSIPVLQVLAVVVVLRTWMAIPTTLLKATGHHREVARMSAVSAVASVLLSLWLVQTVGLIGAALGTAVPAAVLAMAIIFPRACQATRLGVWSGYRQIVWPAVWPIVPVVIGLTLTRHLVPPHLMLVLGHLGLGALVYFALFVGVGLDRKERRWMWSAVAAVRQGRPQLAAA